MDIVFATRSRFLGACDAAITRSRAKLEAGSTVHVDLGEGGYNGNVEKSRQPSPRKPAVFFVDMKRTSDSYREKYFL